MLAEPSRVYVAHVIALDNAFELALGPRRPWLISYAMWATCAFGPGGAAATNRDGMRRWGWVTYDGDTVVPTPAAERAAALWPEIHAAVLDDWRVRFGAAEVDALRAALPAPAVLPMLRHGLFCGDDGPPADDVFAARVAGALLPIAREHESRAKVSLAISANVLPALDARVAELPRATGLSKEAIAMAIGWLERADLLTVEKDGRARVARLTPRGRRAQSGAARRIAAISVDLPLAPFTEPELLAACAAPPGTWRAERRPPQTLPAFPTVLHRGGFPDGS